MIMGNFITSSGFLRTWNQPAATRKRGSVSEHLRGLLRPPGPSVDLQELQGVSAAHSIPPLLLLGTTLGELRLWGDEELSFKRKLLTSTAAPLDPSPLEVQGRSIGSRVGVQDAGRTGHACHSFVPKATLPHPILREEGLPRSSDERHCVSPSIRETIPDWSLPNPLIIPVHQVDDSPGDNQWLLPCTPPLAHLPKLTSNNTPMKEKADHKRCSPHPSTLQTASFVTLTP